MVQVKRDKSNLWSCCAADDEDDVRDGGGVFPAAPDPPEAAGSQHAAPQVQGDHADRARLRAETAQGGVLLTVR